MRRLALPLFLIAAGAPMAAAQPSPPPAPRMRTFSAMRQDDGTRAMLGVTTASSGTSDTLGLLVESVTPGSPAEHAGLEEGDRIAAINGVSLKLARGDAGAPDMAGALTSRLIREMGKLKPGDEATLDLWNAGRSRTVKVKTVAADELDSRRMIRADAEDRPALGVSLGSIASKRDTLGVFVAGVTASGPAAKAGVIEGDRIASVNGVDLRVAKEDAGDWSAASARIARLQREVAKLKPGQSVELSVVAAGRARAVKVTLGSAGDLERNGFSFLTGEGGPVVVMPRIREELDREMPRIREELDREMPRIREELDREMPRIREQIDREMPQAMDQARRSMERLRIELPSLPALRARIGRGVII